MRVRVWLAGGLLLGAAVLGSLRLGAASTKSNEIYDAIRRDDLARLRTLVADDANARDERGITPLMNAAAYGSIDAMRLLIDAGADVNAANEIGSTALMWSVDDAARVRLLLEHGADVNKVSTHGRTAAFVAAMSDRSAEVVRLLLDRGARADVVDNIGMTLLHAATFGADPETIRLVVDAGADVNAADAARYTPLMNAAQRGVLPAVKLLIAKGANVNAVSDRGDVQTHANRAVKNGPLAIARFTPLLLASATSQVDAMKALIDAGADVNAADVRGLTPLMTAVASDHARPEAVRLLLAHGADLTRRSEDGETALDWARKFGRTPIVGLLEAAGAKGTPVPTPATEASPTSPDAAIARALPLLEKTTTEFAKRGGCSSCHAQNITDVAVAAARRRGVPIDASHAAARLASSTVRFEAAAPMLLERVDPPGTPDPLLYGLYALAAIDYRPDRMTDGMVSNLELQQLGDGRWFAGGVSRPPIQDGDITRTALAIRALTVYGVPARRADTDERVRRAVAWLRAAVPATLQDRNMKLLGLYWAGAPRGEIQSLGAAILAKQRPDGGWAQRDELASDAYATGQAIVALQDALKVAGTDPAIARGARFLASTQRADGSWFVRSRSPKFQPYFDSGFPYGGDQWISSMATAWATAALAGSGAKPASTH